MSMERCPNCGWPTGPGCEMCNQEDVRTAAPEEVRERLDQLMGEVEERAIYKRALELWGPHLQVGMLAEEACEMAVAAHHILRTSSSAKPYFRAGRCHELAEEIADVEIMIGQMRAMGLGNDIDTFKKQKLERLRKRIEEATDGSGF